MVKGIPIGNGSVRWLRDEVARLSKISMRQSAMLAQALYEKNRETNGQLHRDLELANRTIADLQYRNEQLREKISAASKAFALLKEL